MEARVSLRLRGTALRFAALGLCVAIPARAQPTKDQCIDANEAAQRFKKADALVQARSELDVCLHVECPGPVRNDCIELAKAVDAAMPTVVFEAYDARGARVNNVHVTMDGRPFAEQSAA